jgi:hypothetical protein
VVVVVADACLVARGAAGGLDATEQPGVRHGVEAVVDGLDRHRAEHRAHVPRDGLGVRVPVELAHGPEHGDARRSGAQAVVAEALGELVSRRLHGAIVATVTEEPFQWLRPRPPAARAVAAGRA